MTDGHFVSPRGMAIDRAGRLVVVDLSGRIQQFAPDGRHLRTWALPAHDVGNPEDLAIDRDGNLLVADTHYQRILRYSPEGALLGEFGGKGTGPGEFIYPVGLAVGADGSIYISEYGGNDRVQVFTSEGAYLRGWGRFGEGPGEFNRPQDVAVDDLQDRVYVADAANHRIQVFTRAGEPRGILGQAGPGPAELCYPYGLDWYRGHLVVCEYGNNRIRFVEVDGAKGAPVSWGRMGSDPGMLSRPWHTVHDAAGFCYVADTENCRIQKFRWP